MTVMCTAREVSNDKDQGYIGYILLVTLTLRMHLEYAAFNLCASCDVKLLIVQ